MEELDTSNFIHIHIKPEFAFEIKGDDKTYLYNITLYYEQDDGSLIVIGSHPPLNGEDLFEFVIDYHCLKPEWISKIEVCDLETL